MERAMNTVFDLWYIRGYHDREDTELHIGVYGTRENAENAVERLKDKPGFRDWPDGFEVRSVTLDRDHWTEGFRSVRGPRPDNSGLETYDLPCLPEAVA
jgi:hypothetical protein